MSITQGLSGLQAVTRSLEVIGNNISNTGTFGAKASRAEFAEVYSSSLGAPGDGGAGSGVKVSGITQKFSQGGITNTGNVMDLAIDGRGFFMLQNADGKELYSRNGQFQVDKDGNVVNAQGLQLMGALWDDVTGRPGGVPQPMKVQLSSGDVVMTGQGSDPARQGVQMALNLSSDAAKITAAFSKANASTYNFSTSQTLYDGQGSPKTMTYYFQKADPNKWNLFLEIDGNVSAAQTLEFDPTSGKLDKLNATAGDTDFTLTLAPFTNLPVNIKGMTQYSGSFAVTKMAQDGFSYGELTSVSFSDAGILQASYSNGHVKNLYQLQLADFTALGGLRPVGGNAWESTYKAGSKVVNTPGANGIGMIQGGALEQSNIDLTTELVDMITAQRMYQANAQTIKTMDQALQTLVNLR